MQVFVFPLGQTVFFPGTSKPLNVFEPRYLQMIEDSIRVGTPIALGYVDDSVNNFNVTAGECLSFVRPIVGIGQPVIVERRNDGTVLVFVKSIGKAELGQVVRTIMPYIVCEATIIDELNTVSDDQLPYYATLNKLLVSWIHKNIPDTEAQRQFLDQIQTPQEVIGCFSAFMVLDPDLQQVVLEENSLDGKIRLLSGIIAGGEILK